MPLLAAGQGVANGAWRVVRKGQLPRHASAAESEESVDVAVVGETV
jgi:hypothetical protein